MGPLVIDNSYIEDRGGGFGNEDWAWSIRGHVMVIQENEYAPERGPIAGRVRTDKSVLRDFSPVAGGRIVRHQACGIAPLENRRTGQGGIVPERQDAGWGSDGDDTGTARFTWPDILVRGNLPDFPGKVEAQRFAPTQAQAWLFTSPLDYALESDWLAARLLLQVPVRQAVPAGLHRPRRRGSGIPGWIRLEQPAGVAWGCRGLGQRRRMGPGSHDSRSRNTSPARSAAANAGSSPAISPTRRRFGVSPAPIRTAVTALMSPSPIGTPRSRTSRSAWAITT